MQSLVVLLMITCLIAVAIAGVDLVWQRFDHMRRLRMSFQDLREEARQSEGDPHMKAQRRSRREAIATNRMLLDVPKADVVIVNPTHFAVALKWSRARGSARSASPRARTRWRSGSARSRRPPGCRCTATRRRRGRCIATVEIGREIAPEHYRAVAAAIRFADRMRRAARARGAAMTPAALRRLLALAEARKARDLARLDGLLAEDRRLAAEIAEARRTAARDLAGRRGAAAGAAGRAAGLGRPADPRGAGGGGRRWRRRSAPRGPRRCRASASIAAWRLGGARRPDYGAAPIARAEREAPAPSVKGFDAAG